MSAPGYSIPGSLRPHFTSLKIASDHVSQGRAGAFLTGSATRRSGTLFSSSVGPVITCRRQCSARERRSVERQQIKPTDVTATGPEF
jgi:hypothetical protein